MIAGKGSNKRGRGGNPMVKEDLEMKTKVWSEQRRTTRRVQFNMFYTTAKVGEVRDSARNLQVTAQKG